MSDGSRVTVEGFIASGGQGEVYAVRTADGSRKALKWYTSAALCGNAAFYAAVSEGCSRPAPRPSFIWPESVTAPAGGSFGYVMRLRPDDYLVFGEFFCIDRHPEAWFRSPEAKVRAATALCEAFAALHGEGLCFRDLNDGNVLFNPHSGDLLICDSDNVVAADFNTGIAGKTRYMAPEVAAGGAPTVESDCFSLAVILYRIFMVDHPFEGALTAGPRYACLTPAARNRLYGVDAVFCHDDTDSRNRPVAGLHDNSLVFWPRIPAPLRNAFCKALSHRAIICSEARTKAADWQRIIDNL